MMLIDGEWSQLADRSFLLLVTATTSMMEIHPAVGLALDAHITVRFFEDRLNLPRFIYQAYNLCPSSPQIITGSFATAVAVNKHNLVWG